MLGTYFLISTPFTYIFSVTALMIRDKVIYSRKGYNSNDSEYQILYWVATLVSYISMAVFFLGIYFLAMSFMWQSK